MLKNQTSTDLAEYVYSQLSLSKIKSNKPSKKILDELFSTLYYTSLQTEEGQFIKVTVTLLNNSTVEEFDEKTDRYDKWQFYPFEPEMEFSIKNLVKLSKAADPWSSSLAVYYDENEKLFIYGMIDQSLHYQSFLNYEREEKPEHPGILQIMINGIGILNVMLDYQALATLNQNSLVKIYPNVFKVGPVSEYLKDNSILSQTRIEEIIGEKLSEGDTKSFHEATFKYVVQAISRILLRIKSYHHGGAILITKDFVKGLKTKYPLKYNRISLSINHMIKSTANSEYFQEEIKKLRRKGRTIPVKLHDEYVESEMDVDDAYNEMIGAIRFVSSLSCVDGLILLSPRLKVLGFGTVITEKITPKYVWICKNSKATRTGKTDADHFGTRHRSMFSYCLKHPESIGFVVSQDGEIRAIKCIDEEIFIWENIKVYQFERSNKMPPLRPFLLPKV